MKEAPSLGEQLEEALAKKKEPEQSKRKQQAREVAKLVGLTDKDLAALDQSKGL
jgi:hypothetical protein